jgi:plasmid stabilization system protein ParE
LPRKVRHPQLLNARTFRVSNRFDKHLIFYQVCEGQLEILRVLHGAQDIEELFSEQE